MLMLKEGYIRALQRDCVHHGAWGRRRRCRDLRLRQKRCDADPSDDSCGKALAVDDDYDIHDDDDVCMMHAARCCVTQAAEALTRQIMCVQVRTRMSSRASCGGKTKMKLRGVQMSRHRHLLLLRESPRALKFHSASA